MSEESERAAKPWDLFDPRVGRVTDEIARERLELCKTCEHYVSLLHQCSECGCIMNAKVKLPNAFCPLRKWATAPATPPPHT